MTEHLRSIRDLLAAHPFFEGLPAADLELLAGCGHNEHLAAGAVLFEEGGEADRFFVIRRGRVALEVHAPGRPGIVVATLAEGDVVGWSWLFPPYRWQFDARVLDAVDLVVLDGTCLRGKCEDDTDLGYRLMRRFARLTQRRLQSTRLQLLDLYGEGRPVPGDEAVG